MCHHPKRFFEDCVDFNMHEEIEEPKKATGIEEKKLPEVLEEAAEEYATKWHKRPDGSEWKSIFPKAAIRDFKAGAEWGMNQCPLPEDTTIFMKGVAEGKRLMMDEAVAVEVVGEKRDLRLIDSTQRCLFNAERGDWLKIIIVKENEK